MEELRANAKEGEWQDRGPGSDDAFADVLVDLESRRGAHAREGSPGSLRCVSSGYLEHGCSCRASVPFEAVSAAWRRELGRAGEAGDRFFRFAWSDEVWLAYGLADGTVRGVYCPDHSAERDERAFAAGFFSKQRPSSIALGA